MPRGIAWDDLPNPYLPGSAERRNRQSPTTKPKVEEKREVNLERDLTEIARRMAFGSLTGGFTGACFGFVEVLRNPKLMTGKSHEARNKILGFTYRFAGFFGFYHGMRKTLKFYVPLDPEMNVGIAAGSCLAPMALLPKLRPLIPYALVMIGTDVINGIDDI